MPSHWRHVQGKRNRKMAFWSKEIQNQWCPGNHTAWHIGRQFTHGHVIDLGNFAQVLNHRKNTHVITRSNIGCVNFHNYPNKRCWRLGFKGRFEEFEDGNWDYIKVTPRRSWQPVSSSLCKSHTLKESPGVIQGAIFHLNLV